MKTVMKNLLLGSVAGLAMVGTAAAADLPVKAKAAEYVKICSTYGAGFYYIPGTDTCLKVGGTVVADTYWVDGDYDFRGSIYDGPDGEYDDIFNFGVSGNETYFRTRGEIKLDARTQTEYGTLRTFLQFRLEYGSNGGIANEFTEEDGFGFGDGIYGGSTYGGGGSSYQLKYGYIQFAGFTFGRATSNFDFWVGDGWVGIVPGDFYSDVTTNQVAYTADFGNGFSATIAIEDQYARESLLEGFAAFEPIVDNQDIPDIVGNIQYEGSWGAAKLSAAYHDNGENYDYSGFGLNGGDGDAGWAVLGGVRFDIAETTTLYIEGVYSDGAAGYAGLAGLVPDVDFLGDGVKAWYVGGSLRHYWTPTVFTTLVGSYAQADNFTTLLDVEGDFNSPWFGTTEYTGYNVGVNIGWQPVKGLTLALQYDYLSSEYSFDGVEVDYPDFLSVDAEYTQNRITFSASRSF